MNTIQRDDRGPIKRTIGDEASVPCPSCDKRISLQDITTDGCLKPGFVDQCAHCEAEFEIDEVEYSATVWVVPHVAAEPRQASQASSPEAPNGETAL
jgi:hypothetical protein